MEVLRRHERGKQPESVRVSQLCRQKLLHYAESFEELANSLDFMDSPKDKTSNSESDRCETLEARRLMENRLLIRHNFSEMAKIMENLAEELVQCYPMEQKRQKMLLHALRAESIYAGQFCYITRKETEKRSICMTLHTDKKCGYKATEVADMLSVLLGHALQVSANSPYMVNQEPQSFLFVEEARYVVLTGFCKATKENETVSGDHYSILESEKGRTTLLLSDGTGSGEQASRDSEKTLDLMEKFLEAGYDTEPAVDMVNVAFLAGEGELNHPTLDICDMNLYDGSCKFLKIGGAASFLKRGDTVEKIQQGTLPLGIFRNLEGTEICRQLQDGDYIIMLTDGVLDAFSMDGYDNFLEDALAELTLTGPCEIAEKLLESAIRFSEGHIRDDMTILVAGIFENTSV